MLLLTALCVAAVARRVCWRVAGAERPVPGLRGRPSCSASRLWRRWRCSRSPVRCRMVGRGGPGRRNPARQPDSAASSSSRVVSVPGRLVSPRAPRSPRALAGTVNERRSADRVDRRSHMGLHGRVHGRLRVGSRRPDERQRSLADRQPGRPSRAACRRALQGQIMLAPGRALHRSRDGSAGTLIHAPHATPHRQPDQHRDRHAVRPARAEPADDQRRSRGPACPGYSPAWNPEGATLTLAAHLRIHGPLPRIAAGDQLIERGRAAAGCAVGAARTSRPPASFARSPGAGASRP